MAVRGAESKNVVFAKLQEIFPDAFWEDQGKILRIPLDENGTRVEIKVSLTAAKNNLGGDSVPSAFEATPATHAIPSAFESVPVTSTEPTQEEKENVSRLIASLGL